MEAKPEPRRRKSHIKTKSGCKTCKLRKVKCGEEKPICLRCIRMGLQCGGYPQPKEYSRRGRPSGITEKPILPKEASREMISTSESSSTSSSSPPRKRHTAVDHALLKSLSTTRFKSQQEYRFHQLFRSKVAGELSGFFPSNIWHRYVLQAAEAEPFLLDTVIAIGALHKVITDAPDLKDTEAHQRSNQEHKFALERYHNSLGSMRKALADGRMGARTALLACLLTICFDSFNGSRDTATFNMLSGVGLAKQITPGTSNSAMHGAEPAANLITASVEDELIAMFTRLDITCMVFIDHRTPEEHRTMIDKLDQTIGSLHKEYYTLEQAIRDGEMIMARCWHFIKIIQEIGQEIPGVSDYLGEARPQSIRIRYGWNPWTGSDKPVPARWLAESERCVHEIEQWSTAFDILMRNFQSAPTTYAVQLLQAALVSVQVKFTLLSVRGCVHRRELDWDVHLSNFQEVVTLTETLLASQPKQLCTSFESDILVPLFYSICKCRDGKVRRRVLKLFEDYPRREATWDSRYCVKLGYWLIDIEEGERGPLESPEIPEEQRLRLFALDYDPIKGSMRTWAGQRTLDGETVAHSFSWN